MLKEGLIRRNRGGLIQPTHLKTKSNGFGKTPEEALEDLKHEMQKILIREYWDFSTNPPSIKNDWSETCAYIIEGGFQVYRQTDIGPDLEFDLDNPPTDEQEIIDALSEVL